MQTTIEIMGQNGDVQIKQYQQASLDTTPLKSMPPPLSFVFRCVFVTVCAYWSIDLSIYRSIQPHSCKSV